MSEIEVTGPEVQLDTGATVAPEFLDQVLDEETAKIRATVGEQAWSEGTFGAAEELFTQVATAEDFAAFLTVPAYETLP